MMERLTGYNSFGGAYGIGMRCRDNTDTINAIITRLAYYEDMEEQGRLVVLPCKVGDWVYKVHYKEIHRHHVCQVHIGQTPAQTFFSCYGEYFGIEQFGKTVFLTREEAEQALKGGAENA